MCLLLLLFIFYILFYTPGSIDPGVIIIIIFLNFYYYYYYYHPHTLSLTPRERVVNITSGNITSDGWQVILCDPIRHVSSRSGEASCELLYSVYLYLLPVPNPIQPSPWMDQTHVHLCNVAINPRHYSSVDNNPPPAPNTNPDHSPKSNPKL